MSRRARLSRQVQRVVVLCSLLGTTHVLADEAAALRNWFDDPFFQVRSAIKDCPVPLGPLTTGDEMRTQTHNRSERGTRCFQEGRCTRPNSFMYDKDIAGGVRAKFADTRAWRNASLWVTVQRRIVWIEGCVAPGYKSGQLDRLVRDVPDVELVVVNVRKRPGDPAPYRRLDGITAPRPTRR
jgi:hypothetical protein